MVRRVTGAQEFMPVRYYVAAVAILGAAALLVSISTIHLELIDPLMLAILLGLAALTQRLPVFLFRSSAISVSFAAVIASYVLYGTGVGVVVSLVQALVNAFTPRRKPLVKALFNTGCLATAAFVAGEIYRLLAPERGDIASTLL